MFTDTMSIVKMLEDILVVLQGSTTVLLGCVWGVMCPCMFGIFVNARPDDEESVQVMS
jgi:hypothetical protein